MGRSILAEPSQAHWARELACCTSLLHYWIFVALIRNSED